MKKKIYFKILSAMLCLTALISSCGDEEKRGPLVTDAINPGPVTGLVATPTPGGAKLTYVLPLDKDILGVQVAYKLPSGEDSFLNASLYKNSIDIVGLLEVKETTVKVITTDQGGNESEPVSISFTPLEAPVNEAANSLEITPDFGGAKFNFTNPTAAALDFFYFTEGANNEEVLLGSNSYATDEEQSFTERGFDTELREFSGYFRDRWGNVSETIKVSLKPLFEQVIPKTGHSRYTLPHDVPVYGGNVPGDTPASLWTPEQFYDDVIDIVGPTGFRTLDGAGSDDFDPNPLPEYRNQFNPSKVTAHLYTIDLGVSAKLSRFTYHPLVSGYFRLGGWRIFDVWGTNETPNAEGTFDGWTKLLDNVEPVTPDNANQLRDEIITKGVEFLFNSETVRYIRFAWKENYTPIKSFNATEITFYGKVLDE